MPEATGEIIRLEHRLAQARRAWKRTAALSGLVVVASETAGLLALAVLADVLFAPERTGRAVLLGLVVLFVLYLLGRHVMMPLFRKVTDAQLALYLEERNPQFEGALIAAVEFGSEQGLTPRQAEIIRTIIHEAVARVEQFDLRRALDFTRFKKYGVVAAGLVGLYLVLGLVMPDLLGRHLVRVATPWKATPEEVEARLRAEELRKPVAFLLSRGNTSLLRGSSFDLDATLSRKPAAPVTFHFRAFDAKSKSAAWRQLPMKEAERLNGYQFVLPDVNEDLEFFVAAGDAKSAAYRINVYDPLTLQGTQVTVRFPAYLKRADETAAAASPDVTALEGSTVTVSLETNRPLREGRITWADGKTAAFTVDKDHPQAAAAAFEVKTDASYTYTLTDVDGQVLQSPGPVTVHAVADKPPTIKLLAPEPATGANPLGEIAFTGEVGDDFGIAGAELVFTRGTDPKAAPARLPLQLADGKGAAVLMLEKLAPAVQPGDLLTCYLECRDLKGQKAVSDLVLLTVTPFDVWTTWAPPENGGTAQMAKLDAVLKAAWTLHAQKDVLPRNDFNTQSEELAATMIDPATKKLVAYVDTGEMKGEPLEHANKAIALIGQGHKDLKGHATDIAIDDFRAALSELALAGVTEIIPQMNNASTAATADKMKELENVKSEPPPPASTADASAPASTAKAEAEKANADKVAKMLEKQNAVVQKMKDAKAAKSDAKDAKTKAAAAEQKNLAAAAKAAAAAMKEKSANANDKATAEKLDAAARAMFKAGDALDRKEHDAAVKDAEAAARNLAALVIEIKAKSQDELGRLLDQTERAAERLKQDQADVRKKTADLADVMKGKAPDAKQQRELKAATAQQAKINAGVEALAKLVEQLKTVGDNGQMRADTAKLIEDADMQMKRSRVAQKTANAAVELAAEHPDNAAAEQVKAETGLAKVVDAVRAANDARATGHEAELKRAKGEADRIKEAVARVKADPAAAKENAAQAVDEAKRLARHLKLRDLTGKDAQAEKDAKRLEELTADPVAAQQKLEKEAKASEFAQVTARLQNRLEAEYQAMLAAKSLFASQREECPPEYRRLVNQYFEALSTQK